MRDVVIVGAGFGGLYALHRLRGEGFDAQVYEAGGGVGGTWYWNRYPGARCDVESMDYSFSIPILEQEWEWSERYAAQPEIRRYLEYATDKLDLRRSITLNTRIAAAEWMAESSSWKIRAETGEVIGARFLILATGSLSAAKSPDIAGASDFAGTTLHTADWPEVGCDVAGLRVGVIGTGSSGVQVIPILAQDAADLFVFQRTPGFSVPAHNHPLSAEYVSAFRQRYSEHRQATRQTRPGVIFQTTGRPANELRYSEQVAAMEAQWNRGGADFPNVFTDIITDESANEVAADFVRAKIASVVKDKAVAESLTPRGYPLAAKRLCLDTNYYETFNRPNVHLVDLAKAPIDRIEPDGVRTVTAHYALDVLVFATGFDAMTGSILRIDIRGENGIALRERWAAGPLTYLGLMVHELPNLFLIAGPGSPSVLTNMVASVEQHADWITDCLLHMRQRERTTIKATAQAERDWVARVNRLANTTLFVKGQSWYLGANVPGKPRVFMPYVGGLAEYRSICNRIAANDYTGFAFL